MAQSGTTGTRLQESEPLEGLEGLAPTQDMGTGGVPSGSQSQRRSSARQRSRRTQGMSQAETQDTELRHFLAHLPESEPDIFPPNLPASSHSTLLPSQDADAALRALVARLPESEPDVFLPGSPSGISRQRSEDFIDDLIFGYDEEMQDYIQHLGEAQPAQQAPMEVDTHAANPATAHASSVQGAARPPPAARAAPGAAGSTGPTARSAAASNHPEDHDALAALMDSLFEGPASDEQAQLVQAVLAEAGGGSTTAGQTAAAAVLDMPASPPAPPEPDVPEPGCTYQPPRLDAADIQGDYLPVVSASGARVYCALGQPADECEKLSWATIMYGARASRGVRSTKIQLLSRPISHMLREAQEAQLQSALDESRRLAAQLVALDRQILTDTADTEAAGGAEAAAEAGEAQAQQQQQAGGSSRDDGLWVSKYAPRSFMSLLSDEQTNREVAKWVKSWDTCVFGGNTGAAAAQAAAATKQAQQAGTGFAGRSTARPVPGAAGRSGAGASGGAGAGQEDSRPAKKVILLCGPPGLGKTTLAHVVARHCGYHPFEINASDERTATTLTEKVSDAVQMKAVLGEKRPNCVIIDEIDGATGGAEGHSAIAALINIITAGSKPTAGGKSNGKKGGKKGRSLLPLSRPIICIANDLYAPALRPLRDLAQVFHFKPPDMDKLVSRLTHICTLEGLHADKAALVSLAQRSDCDIRTCLNTLQFLAKQHGHRSSVGATPTPHRHRQQQQQAAGRSNNPLTSPTPAATTAALAAAVTPAATRHRDPGIAPRTPRAPAHHTRITVQQVEQLQIGSKDTHKSMFNVWDAMFQQPKQGGGGGGSRAAGWGGVSSHFAKMHSMLQDSGEYELIMSGLQENLLSMRYLDVHLKHTSEMMEALVESDCIISAARRRSDFHLMQYVPSRLLLIHMRAASQERPHLQWPKAQGDASRRSAASQELLRTWAGCKVAGRVLQAHHVHALTQDVLPALLRLLSPSLRPLAPHLQTPAEQAAMRSTAQLLVDYGLRYSLEEEGEARPGSKGYMPGGGLQLGGVTRPVPLDPPLDLLQTFGAHRPRSGAQALKPVPAVLRQMLNQQATLESIRRAEAAGPGAEQQEMVCDLVVAPGAGTTHQQAAAAAAAGGQQGRIGHLLGVQVKPSDKAAGPLQAVNLNNRDAAGLKPKASNWLDTFRMNAAANKRRAVGSLGKQDAKKQAVGADGCDSSDGQLASPSSKHQFPVLYRYNEGYTNAVKRPILMKELL